MKFVDELFLIELTLLHVSLGWLHVQFLIFIDFAVAHLTFDFI